LHVVAETSEKQIFWDLLGKKRRGRAGGEKHEVSLRGDLRRRKHHVGVREADQACDLWLIGDELARLLRDDLGLGLTVDQDHFHPAPENPAALIGKFDGKTRPLRGRDVEILLAAGQIVDRANNDRAIACRADNAKRRDGKNSQ
jgi:hypothetical protein